MVRPGTIVLCRIGLAESLTDPLTVDVVVVPKGEGERVGPVLLDYPSIAHVEHTTDYGW